MSASVLIVDPMPSRWAVELRGDSVDLTEAADLLGKDNQVCVRSGVVTGSPDVTLLSAKEFEVLPTAAEVHSAGERILALLNGILYVQEEARKPIAPGGVRERLPNGQWSITMLVASATFTLRGVKAGGVVSGQSTPPPREASWMTAGLDDDVVSDVLTYLRGQPDWFDLYKAFEAMNDDVGRRSTELNWPTVAERNEFKRDAQLHRHSREWCERKHIAWTGSMELAEARTLIRSMARAWLDRKCRSNP
jgi:hypothetical protein